MKSLKITQNAQIQNLPTHSEGEKPPAFSRHQREAYAYALHNTYIAMDACKIPADLQVFFKIEVRSNLYYPSQWRLEISRVEREIP